MDVASDVNWTAVNKRCLSALRGSWRVHVSLSWCVGVCVRVCVGFSDKRSIVGRTVTVGYHPLCGRFISCCPPLLTHPPMTVSQERYSESWVTNKLIESQFPSAFLHGSGGKARYNPPSPHSFNQLHRRARPMRGSRAWHPAPMSSPVDIIPPPAIASSPVAVWKIYTPSEN